MSDVNAREPRGPDALLYLRDEELRLGAELLAAAVRASAADAAAVLEGEGLGRAHHRALSVIGRRSGLPVSELLRTLGVTKQSFNRVLRVLTARGLVVQRPGETDRRQRLLVLTDEGRALDEKLWAQQRARLLRAFREAGPEAVAGFRKVLGNVVGRSRP